MLLKRRSLLLLPFLSLILSGSAIQKAHPRDYFRSPLGIPLKLAGSFAEMRSNHFHSGLDIKTNNQTGYRVYAAADGWISRISVSPSGFGNALYVSHPNGYMTVYGHLDRFSEEVNEYVKNLQYRNETFAINQFPDNRRFPVKKGQVIAFSGNSGSSSGPHLHFEVRDQSTGWPENPLLFGFDVPDTRPPRIYRIKLYAIDATSSIRINDSRTGGWRTVRGGESAILDVTQKGGLYIFSRADRIQATGRIGFGIQTHDYHDGSTNRLGAYKITLNNNGVPLFSSTMNRFSFGQTRFINAHIDYAEHLANRRWIQRSFIVAGNRLQFYESRQDGLLTVESGAVNNMVYRIADTNGNESLLPFRIEGMDSQPTGPEQPGSESLRVAFDQPFTLSMPGIIVQMPAGSVYENLDLDYGLMDRVPKGVFSPVHRIHDRLTPMHKASSISIDASGLPANLRSRALLASVDSKGNLSSAGGKYNRGWVTAQVRSFGNYAIAVDTLAPSIRPLNISRGKNMRRSGNIRFRIRDDFSGVGHFRGEIDGQWVLFAYDAKISQLKYTFDERIVSGNHSLRLEVEDNTGNVAVYETTFSR